MKSVTEISKKRFYSNCLFAAILIKLKLPNSRLCFIPRKYWKFIDPVVDHENGAITFHVVVIHENDPNIITDSIIDFIPSKFTKNRIFYRGHYRVLNNLGIDDIFNDLVKAAIYHKKTKDELIKLIDKYEKKLKYKSSYSDILRNKIPEELLRVFKKDIDLIKSGNYI